MTVNNPSNAIDGTEVTQTAQLLDISDQTLRNALTKNIFGSDHTFRVQALNDAIPMSSQALDFLINSPNDVNSQTSRPMHWIFKGRIIDLQARPSPHIFCQDPCDLTTAPPEARGLSAQFQQLHMDFIVATDTPQVIKKNDEIIVSLSKGTPYQFDLQKGYCDNPSIRAYSSTNLDATLACQSMQNLDFSQISTPLGGVEIPVSSGGIQYALSEGLFQHHISFMEDLRAKINDSDPSFPNLIVTSAYRNPLKQSSVMFSVIRDSGETEWRHLYRHMGTPVLDQFMSFYSVGDVNSGAALVERAAAEGKYFSSHLRSEALDLRTLHLTDAQVNKLQSALGSVGVSSQLLEPRKTDCWADQPPVRQKNSDGTITPGAGNCTREHIHLRVPSKYLKTTT